MLGSELRVSRVHYRCLVKFLSDRLMTVRESADVDIADVTDGLISYRTHINTEREKPVIGHSVIVICGIPVTSTALSRAFKVRSEGSENTYDCLVCTETCQQKYCLILALDLLRVIGEITVNSLFNAVLRVL